MTGRERPRRANFHLAVVGLVVISVGLSAIFLWTRYPSPIALVLAMLCIFIGLVLVGSGMGLGWFPMMGVEKWKLGNSVVARRSARRRDGDRKWRLGSSRLLCLVGDEDP